MLLPSETVWLRRSCHAGQAVSPVVNGQKSIENQPAMTTDIVAMGMRTFANQAMARDIKLLELHEHRDLEQAVTEVKRMLAALLQS